MNFRSLLYICGDPCLSSYQLQKPLTVTNIRVKIATRSTPNAVYTEHDDALQFFVKREGRTDLGPRPAVLTPPPPPQIVLPHADLHVNT